MIRLNTLAPRQGEKKDAVRIGRGPGSGSGKTSGFNVLKVLPPTFFPGTP